MIAAALALVLAAAAAGAPAAPPPAGDPPTQLEPIQVTPPPDPLDALRNVRKSLPCVGCGEDIIKAKPSLTERALRYFLLPSEPKEPTEYEKDRAQLFCSDPGSGNEFYCSP